MRPANLFRFSGALGACLALQSALISPPPALASATPPVASISGEDLVRRTQVRVDPASAQLATAIVFLSARCPCSASHEETLNRLAREYPRIRFVAIHSNADESVEESRKHFEAAGLPFPVIQDPGARIADRLGAFKTPHVYLVDRSGDLIFQGGVDDSHIASLAKQHFFEDALRAVREGRKPEIAQARALGCVIQRP